MKRFAILMVPVMLLLSAQTDDPKGFAIWTVEDLGTHSEQLQQKMDQGRSASETLADYGNHKIMLSHREASGLAELHERMADIFVVEDGEATLVVGGEIENRKTVSPGEVRGSGITGGARHRLGKGDTVHIPAGIPHQVLVDAGKKFTYFVVKVESR